MKWNEMSTIKGDFIIKSDRNLDTECRQKINHGNYYFNSFESPRKRKRPTNQQTVTDLMSRLCLIHNRAILNPPQTKPNH